MQLVVLYHGIIIYILTTKHQEKGRFYKILMVVLLS